MAKIGNKLKIGFVLDDSLDKTDGVQQYILTLGEWLSNNGHEIHYLVGKTSRSDVPNIHSLSKNIKVKFNGNRMSMPLPSSKEKLSSLLRSEDFDILHIQVPYSPYLAHKIILSAAKRTAIVGTFHIVGDTLLVKTASKCLRNWTHKSLQSFDEIVSVSRAAQSFAEKTYGINSKVIPNVINLAKFVNVSRKSEANLETLTILFLGRLVERKGCHLLLQAIDFLQKESNLPSYKVIICGKGPLENKLKQYVRDHGLSNIVTFVGYVSEVEKPFYYCSADISVFPSSGGESFGIVLLEAMANGHSAVLAGDNVGYRSVMNENPNLLFDPHSAEILSNKLATFIKNKQLRIDAANWGHAQVQQYNVDIVGKQIEKLYTRALHKRSSV